MFGVRFGIFAIVFLLFSQASYGQLVAGIRANGKLINQGDTVTICIGGTISYQSTAQNFSTLSWRFNNGSPTTGNGTAQTVTYNNSGFDTTWQVVTSATDRDSVYMFVKVNNVKPAAGYTFTPDGQCGDVVVNFQNGSTGSGLSYLWTFGDGNTSTAKDPGYQFLNAIGASGTQIYQVKLQVTNDQFCTDTLSQSVTVKRVPDASIGNGRSPDVIFGPFNGEQTFRHCENIGSYEFRFTNASSTAAIINKYTIQWGDNSPDTSFATWPAANLIRHTFSRGKTIMKVMVEGNNGCNGIKTYVVFLGTTPAGSLGNIGNNSICAPNNLVFPINDFSSNAPGTTYTFSINDGTSAETYQHSPPVSVSHLFKVGSCGNFSNSYSNAFSANLFIENPCGSTTSVIVPIYVSGKPRANISLSPTNIICTNTNLLISNISTYGGQITPTGGTGSTCSNNGRQVWTISPSAGVNVTSGSLGLLNGSPTNAGLWTNGTSPLTANFTLAGTYTIKLYVANDLCGIDSTVRTICVRNPPQASFVMSKRIGCGPDTAVIANTSPLGGCLGDTYNWTISYTDPQGCGGTPLFNFINGTTAQSQHPTIKFVNPGMYIVQVTLTPTGTFSCPSASARDTFWVKAKPRVTINTINAVCVGNSITPTASVSNCYSSATPIYNWTFTDGTPSSSNTLAPGSILFGNIGTYPISLEVSNECGVTTATSNAMVTAPPVANAGIDKSICSGASTQIGTNPSPGLTYKWTPITGLSNPNIANPNVTLTYSGSAADTTYGYAVTASAGANCSGTDSVYVLVKRKPVVSITPASPQICAGSNIKLVASGADTYLWSPAAGLSSTTSDTVFASPNVTATYTVTGTTNGCSTAANVIVNVTAIPVANAGLDTLVCNTTAALQLVGTPANGVWTGSTFVTSAGLFNPAAAGNGVYNLVYTAGNGSCNKSDTIRVTVSDPPIAFAGSDSVVCQGGSAFQVFGQPAGGRWSGTLFITTTGIFTPSTAGVYNVIYTIGGGTCIGRDTLVMTVSAGISNNIIAANQTICTGTQPAAIIGQAITGGSGTPSYQWQSSADNITYTNITGATAKDYAPGVLTQTIWYRRIASTTLCSAAQASNSLPVKITVNENAKAEFNPTTASGCVPFVITPAIINLTPYNTIVSEYRWYVNGNYIGSGQNFPGYTMNVSGDSITVKLVAVSRFGCKNDSMQRGFVTLERPVPALTQSDSIGCGPLTITFNNRTPNATRYKFLWNFGQGQTSTLAQPASIVFPINPNFGDTTYTVSMKTISACDTITLLKFVTVRAKPKALFTPDKSVGCSPMVVTFTNTSRGSNVVYFWNFGDGTPVLATNNSTVVHTFSTGLRDTFYVKLKATNDCGTDSLTYAIIANPNSIRLDFAINGNDRFGCAPHTVSFVNNTTGANSFTWNFGDGSAPFNTSKGIDTIVHTYTTAGNFSATLFATNSCNDTTDTELVTVALKPKVAFTASPLIACISDSIRFTNNSDNGISTMWRFGDGTTSFVRNPVKVYGSAGTYRVSLTGSNIFPQGFSCADSAFTTITIRDTLPGSFTATDTSSLCLPFTVTFKNLNGPSSQATWNFGDGTTATGDSVTHTYITQGVFIVKLVSRGIAGCFYSSSKTIRVSAPSGTLSYVKGFVCPGNAVRLEVRGGNASLYKFIFGDGDSLTTASTIVFHQYIKPGWYVPYAYLLEGSCSIKITLGDTVKVDNIKALFKSSPQISCGQTVLQFTDTSIAFFGIRLWQWNFGDGTTSSLQNPLKTFTQNGTYNVRLVVTGFSGCTDTLTIPINIAIRTYPVASIGSSNTACTGQAINFAALVQSVDTIQNYSWTFGNGGIGSGRNTSAIYNTSGTYTIRLIVNTIYGCADTAFTTITVNASPVINAGADVTMCRGQSVQLQAFGANTWLWNPQQILSCTTCFNPVANPLFSTQYVVSGSNNLGCISNDTVIVNVVQPFKITVSPNDSICVGEQTQLFASGAVRYLWNPIAGLSNGTIANPIASPTTTTQYRVIGRDTSNCFADTGYITVAVGNYPTVDLGNGGTVVAGTTVNFNPILTNGPFKNYVWTPAINLSCLNCPRPTATINTNITYRMLVENIYGCTASDTIIYQVVCEEATQVFIPNTFTPDNDGLNDVLMVRGRGLAMVKYFRIFNRWGQLVFERNNFAANDAQQGWDGRINGIPANPEVYVYTAEVICTAGANFVKKGNVTLVR